MGPSYNGFANARMTPSGIPNGMMSAFETGVTSMK